jgi:hypothetical protein
MLRNQMLPFGISYYDLRALLFWASIGISKSKSGSYPDAATHPGDLGIVQELADHIKFTLPMKPKFGSRKATKLTDTKLAAKTKTEEL